MLCLYRGDTPDHALRLIYVASCCVRPDFNLLFRPATYCKAQQRLHTSIMRSDERRPPSPASLPPDKKIRLTMDEAIAEVMRHNDKMRADEV